MERYDDYVPALKYPHPFVHELKLNFAEKIRVTVLGLVLCPIRFALAALCFLLMWPVAKLRFAGLSARDRAQPVQGWRRWLLHPVMLIISRATFFCIGFLWVKVKGRRADPKEAPLLAVAPHSSFLDILVICHAGLATVVSRSENTNLPVIGALLEFNQSLLVSRKDPESRRRCAAQLRERLTSNGRWPQMLLFPEGTTTNGQVLIKFKPGGFMAGVPVQPVLLRYPNKLDATRWTWKGTSWVQALWCTASQLYTNLTVEYLPVYTPSEEERSDPALYANNVQKLMAQALGVPATDYMMEGTTPVRKLGCLSLPLESPATDALSQLRRAGLSSSDIDAALRRMAAVCQPGREKRVDSEELLSLLQLTDKQASVNICGLYSKEGSVDLRQLLLSAAVVSGAWSLDVLIHRAFTLFDGDSKGSLNTKEFGDLLAALLGIAQNATMLYSEISSRGQLTKDDLWTLVTTHPTYQKLFAEYLKSTNVETQGTVSFSSNGNTVGFVATNNGTATVNKKTD